VTTYAELVNRIGRLISDPDISTYAEEIYYDAVCAAHEAILPWLPNYQSAVLTSGSSGVYALPNDVYELQSVAIAPSGVAGKFLSRATLAAGTTRPSSLTDCDWIENPKGFLSLSYTDNADPVLVHYLGYWSKPPLPVPPTFTITVPSCGLMGLVYYAASIVITPVIVDTSTLGPFKQRIDSGTPQMNPMKDTSEWLRTLFLMEMKLMPSYRKATS
jgi:hypothetical protein